jgi:hypothetical protein
MSFFRQIAGPALVTVFATVSFLGTGLHLLPGCGHFHGHIFHAHGHHCTAHHHAGHCHSEPKMSEIGTSHDDCAICRFLAIPRALTPPPAIVAIGLRFEPIVVAAVIPLSLDIERAYGARGPPQLSLNA